MLDERKAAILRAVVEEYIDTAQPVGSAHVVRSSGVQVSSATVRNDMATLEQEGYLRQPHTSAGRIPTEKGYRFFVDNLGQPANLRRHDAVQVRSFFEQAHGELEQMLHDTSRLLGDLTELRGSRRRPDTVGGHRALRAGREHHAHDGAGRDGAVERGGREAHGRAVRPGRRGAHRGGHGASVRPPDRGHPASPRVAAPHRRRHHGLGVRAGGGVARP